MPTYQKLKTTKEPNNSSIIEFKPQHEELSTTNFLYSQFTALKPLISSLMRSVSARAASAKSSPDDA